MKNLQDDPTLVEDLLLLLLRPDGRGSGNIADENTLYCVLAGAVIADLALHEHVRTGSGRMGSTTVEAIETNPPQNHLLPSTWEYVAEEPRYVQTVLQDTRSVRRTGLVHDVRAALVDGVQPSARTAALAALVRGGETLPQFDPEIPWTSTVIARAEELEAGNWGAGAAAEAVARTVTASILTNVSVAAAVLPRS